jgi:transglutaminase-like putative cysteine protease
MSQEEFLESNYYFDYADPAVQAYRQKVLGDESDSLSLKERLKKLYLAVRDDFKYNPYQFNFDKEHYKASICVTAKESYCIPKAVLLGALCRAEGIPARLGLADVKNHISSPRLLKILQSDVFVMHGYTEIYLDGKWLKATPAFDAALCHKMGIEPLAFDAEHDSVFQEYNLDGRKHMEYLKDHGTFAEVPVEKIHQEVARAYPHLMTEAGISNKFASHSLEEELTGS